MTPLKDKPLSVMQAAELYSELVGHPGIVNRSRMSRLIAGGRMGVEGEDWGRLGVGKTSQLWVADAALRQFAAARVAESARRFAAWTLRSEQAAKKAEGYRPMAGEVEP